MAITAALAGAARGTGADNDRFALEAANLNAQANGTGVECLHLDILTQTLPTADVMLAGDAPV